MIITKKDIIQKLYEIADKTGENQDSMVQKVVRNEIIPVEIIKTINKYDTDFLFIYDTYNTIYKARNKNPLYRNLKNPNLNIEEKAIALSSLVTKILISCSKIKGTENKNTFANAMNIDQLNQAITNYAIYGETQLLMDVSKQVQELLDLLYKD